MATRRILLVILAFTWAAALAAQNNSPQQIPALLSRDQEIQLALSAAPAHLKDGAGVYVLEKNGFVKARDTKNGFTCIVNRDHPLNQKPTCYDAEGTATILPKVVKFGELLMKGTPLADIRAEIKKDFETGKFIAPRRPGVAYMLSGDIKNFNPQTGKIDSFPPHVMFYAPNLTNDDIGSDGNFDPGMPSIAYQGSQGFMVVVLPDPKQSPVAHESK